MTEKNTNWDEIRVGTVVAFEEPSTTTTPTSQYCVDRVRRDEINFRNGNALHKVYRDHWRSMGGYIVSQPDEKPTCSAPDCSTMGPCVGSCEKPSVRTREDQAKINKIATRLHPNWQRYPSEAEINFFYELASLALAEARAEQAATIAALREALNNISAISNLYYDDANLCLGDAMRREARKALAATEKE